MRFFSVSFVLFFTTLAAASPFPKSCCDTLLHLAAVGVSEKPEVLATLRLSQPLVIEGHDPNTFKASFPSALVDLPDPDKLWEVANSLPANEFILIPQKGHFFSPSRPSQGKQESKYLIIVTGKIYELISQKDASRAFAYNVLKVEPWSKSGHHLQDTDFKVDPIAWTLDGHVFNPLYLPYTLPLTWFRYKYMAYRFHAPDSTVRAIHERLEGGEGQLKLSAEDFAGVEKVQQQELAGAVDRAIYAPLWIGFLSVMAAVLPR